MAVDVKTVIQELRAAPRVLRIIAVIASLDLVIVLYSMLSLDDDVGARFEKLNQLKSELASLQQKALATRKEIGQLPELRKLYDSALANGVLAAQDRLKFVNLAQELVRDHRLSDFHFKLAPEVSSPLPGGKYQLTSTTVSLTDTAIFSSDVFAFWEEILKRSQAHYEITSAVVERGADDLNTAVANIKAGKPTELVKAELKFRWQSMRVPVVADKPLSAKAASAAPAASAGDTNR